MCFILLITHLLMSFNLKYFKQSFQIANMLGLHTSCFWLVYEMQGRTELMRSSRL